MEENGKYMDAIDFLEARFTPITNDPIEMIEFNAALKLLIDLVYENEYLHNQLREWKRVANVKQEIINELGKGTVKNIE